MQPVNEALIAKFFDGLCTKEEAEQVLAFLKDNPQHPYLLQEWETADNETELPGNYTQEMYDVVEQKIQSRSKIKRLSVLLAAAACISAALILWWPTKQSIAPETIASKQNTPIRWIEKTNNSNTMQVVLPGDGSKISLLPGATIKYAEGFGQTTARTIYMQGEAVFDVAKNKAKPFTVYSNYVNTTALGTSFKVTARLGEQTIKVRLMEGKVVVKLNDSSLHKTQADYYLQPGQELFFKASDKAALLYTFNSKAPAANTKVSNTVHGSANNSTEVEYMFNNQTLADVLDHLSTLYNVPIQYSKTDIGKIYFIGKIDKDDPVEKTIRDIAVLNGLSVTKQNGGFILKKKKH